MVTSIDKLIAALAFGEIIWKLRSTNELWRSCWWGNLETLISNWWLIWKPWINLETNSTTRDVCKLWNATNTDLHWTKQQAMVYHGPPISVRNWQRENPPLSYTHACDDSQQYQIRAPSTSATRDSDRHNCLQPTSATSGTTPEQGFMNCQLSNIQSIECINIGVVGKFRSSNIQKSRYYCKKCRPPPARLDFREGDPDLRIPKVRVAFLGGPNVTSRPYISCKKQIIDLELLIYVDNLKVFAQTCVQNMLISYHMFTEFVWRIAQMMLKMTNNDSKMCVCMAADSVWRTRLYV